jgi:hypothetical protein
MKPLMASEDVEEPAVVEGDWHGITEEGFRETEVEPVPQ